MEKYEAKLLRGKKVADYLTDKVIEDVENLKKEGVIPTLAMVRVGNKEDDIAYQRAAVNRCVKCGIETMLIEVGEETIEEEYVQILKDLNTDDSVHGILCFRPLPNHISEEVVEQYINHNKDVDCFSPINIGKLMYGDENAYPPCTPKAVVDILDYYGIDLAGKKVAIVGRSLVVGKPLSLLVLNRNATVTICHSKTENLRDITQNSDIVISCMGRAKFLDDTYISEGSTVIDVGINFDENGKMCGDVDFDAVINKVKYITPVPGGVGTVTTSVLVTHLVKACR